MRESDRYDRSNQTIFNSNDIIMNEDLLGSYHEEMERESHFLFGMHPNSKLNKPEVDFFFLRMAFKLQHQPAPCLCICNTLPSL